MKNNKKIVLAAVQNWPWALKHASEALKADREVVMAAVKKDGTTLEYASNDLKKDEEIVLAAVKSVGGALKFASEEFKKDKKIVLEAVKNAGRALIFVSEALRKDPEVVLEAMKKNLAASKYSLLSHEETKALLHRISLKFYIPFGKCQLTIFDKKRKNGSYIKQNEKNLIEILSYFSVTDASKFSLVSKETKELLEPDLKEAKSRFN